MPFYTKEEQIAQIMAYMKMIEELDLEVNLMDIGKMNLIK